VEGREELKGAVGLGLADEEGEAASGGEEAGGDGESGFEAFDSTQGDDCGLRGEVLGAGGEYIDIRQCKGADGFAEEGGLFLVGFDEGGVEMRCPDLDRKARESGAGTEVDEIR
jgi:hypothetical protein